MSFDSVILALNPHVYFRMQETGDNAVATDAMGVDDAAYDELARITQGGTSLVPSAPGLTSVDFGPQVSYGTEAIVRTSDNTYRHQGFTIQHCFRLDHTFTDDAFLCRRDFASPSDRQFGIAIYTDNTLAIQYASSGWNWYKFRTDDLSQYGLNILDGDPHICHGVWDAPNDRLELWVDGIMVLSYTDTVHVINNPSSTWLGINQARYSGAKSFPGSQSHWVFWDDPLSAEQLGSIYDAWTGGDVIAYIREYSTLGKDEIGNGVLSFVEPAVNSNGFSVETAGSPINAINDETRFVSIRPVGEDIAFKTGAYGDNVTAVWGTDTLIPDGEELIVGVEPNTVISLVRQE